MPTSSIICNESHQNEYAAIKSITDEEKWHGLCKNTPLVSPSATIYTEHYQNEFATVKSITDEEKRHG
jgi:hypothetical protein